MVKSSEMDGSAGQPPDFESFPQDILNESESYINNGDVVRAVVHHQFILKLVLNYVRMLVKALERQKMKVENFRLIMSRLHETGVLVALLKINRYQKRPTTSMPSTISATVNTARNSPHQSHSTMPTQSESQLPSNFPICRNVLTKVNTNSAPKALPNDTAGNHQQPMYLPVSHQAPRTNYGDTSSTRSNSLTTTHYSGDFQSPRMSQISRPPVETRNANSNINLNNLQYSACNPQFRGMIYPPNSTESVGHWPNITNPYGCTLGDEASYRSVGLRGDGSEVMTQRQFNYRHLRKETENVATVAGRVNSESVVDEATDPVEALEQHLVKSRLINLLSSRKSCVNNNEQRSESFSGLLPKVVDLDESNDAPEASNKWYRMPEKHPDEIIGNSDPKSSSAACKQMQRKKSGSLKKVPPAKPSLSGSLFNDVISEYYDELQTNFLPQPFEPSLRDESTLSGGCGDKTPSNDIISKCYDELQRKFSCQTLDQSLQGPVTSSFSQPANSGSKNPSSSPSHSSGVASSVDAHMQSRPLPTSADEIASDLCPPVHVPTEVVVSERDIIESPSNSVTGDKSSDDNENQSSDIPDAAATHREESSDQMITNAADNQPVGSMLDCFAEGESADTTDVNFLASIDRPSVLDHFLNMKSVSESPDINDQLSHLEKSCDKRPTTPKMCKFSDISALFSDATDPASVRADENIVNEPSVTVDSGATDSELPLSPSKETKPTDECVEATDDDSSEDIDEVNFEELKSLYEELVESKRIIGVAEEGVEICSNDCHKCGTKLIPVEERFRTVSVEDHLDVDKKNEVIVDVAVNVEPMENEEDELSLSLKCNFDDTGDPLSSIQDVDSHVGMKRKLDSYVGATPRKKILMIEVFKPVNIKMKLKDWKLRCDCRLKDVGFVYRLWLCLKSFVRTESSQSPVFCANSENNRRLAINAANSWGINMIDCHDDNILLFHTSTDQEQLTFEMLKEFVVNLLQI